MKIKGFKDTIDWYDKNAENYANAVKNNASIDSLQEFVSLLPKKAIVLDAGCGGGRDSNILNTFGLKVIGLDISRGLLNIAKKKFPLIKFVHGDLRKLPFNNNFLNGIWSHASLVHLESQKDVSKVLLEFHRVLKNSGLIHILVKAQSGKEKTAIVKDKLSNHERFFQYFSQTELKLLLIKAQFQILKIEQYNESQKRKGGRGEVEWILVLAKKI